MPLYKVHSDEKKLQPFLASHLEGNYLERDLEDWIERNPEVLVADEPLLIVGRQVSTPVGTMDLLALDSNGAGIIIELKRAPSQREAIGQALEYASWLSSIDTRTLQDIAEQYLSANGQTCSLGEVWQNTFNTDLQEIMINARQRIFIVIEGENDRMTSLVRYLRASGIDIGLLTYNFYRTETGEEILHLETQVGESEPTSQQDAKPSEASHITAWSQKETEAYQKLKEVFLEKGLYARAKKTGMSFYVQARGGSTFIGYFNAANNDASVWIRSDSMEALMDFDAAASRISKNAPSGSQINHTTTWFIVRFPASAENARTVASLILENVVDKLLENSHN